MKSGRIESIDAAKAIGIVLVIMGHCFNSTLPYMHEFIYSFHMPLFFILSGWFIKESSIWGGVKKYSKRYLIPYVLTGVLILSFIAIWSLTSAGQGISIVEEINKLAIAVAFGSGWAGSWGPGMKMELFAEIPMIGAAWFLFALFWACVTYSCLKRKFKGMVLFGMSLACFALAIYSIRVIRFPFSLQSGLAAVLFLCIGDMLRHYDVITKFSNFKMIEHAPFLVIWLLCIFRHTMRSSSCYYPDMTVAGGIIGTCYLLIVCDKFKFKGGWLGSHTLEILCGNATVLYIKMFFFNLSDMTSYVLVNFMIEFIVDVLLSIGIGYVIFKSNILKRV